MCVGVFEETFKCLVTCAAGTIVFACSHLILCFVLKHFISKFQDKRVRLFNAMTGLKMRSNINTWKKLTLVKSLTNILNRTVHDSNSATEADTISDIGSSKGGQISAVQAFSFCLRNAACELRMQMK